MKKDKETISRILGVVHNFSEYGKEAEGTESFSEVTVGSKVYPVNTVGQGELHIVEGKAYFNYRMLSEDDVATGTRYHTDFTNVSLKESVSKAIGIPFHLDHNDYSSATSYGKVVDAYYSEGIDGGSIGGINGIIEIDTTATFGSIPPLELAKKIKNGYILSGSMQVKFSYKRSHPTLEGFDYKVGRMVDGKPVKKIALGIAKFYEFSALSHGADKNALVLVNEKTSYIQAVRSSFSESRETEINTVLIPASQQKLFGTALFEDNKNAEQFESVSKYMESLETKFNEVQVKLTAANTSTEDKTTIVAGLRAEIAASKVADTASGAEVVSVCESFNENMKDLLVEHNNIVLKLKALDCLKDVEVLPLTAASLVDVADGLKSLTSIGAYKTMLNKQLGLDEGGKKPAVTTDYLNNGDYEKRQKQLQTIFG